MPISTETAQDNASITPRQAFNNLRAAYTTKENLGSIFGNIAILGQTDSPKLKNLLSMIAQDPDVLKALQAQIEVAKQSKNKSLAKDLMIAGEFLGYGTKKQDPTPEVGSLEAEAPKQPEAPRPRTMSRGRFLNAAGIAASFLATGIALVNRPKEARPSPTPTDTPKPAEKPAEVPTAPPSVPHVAEKPVVATATAEPTTEPTKAPTAIKAPPTVTVAPSREPDPTKTPTPEAKKEPRGILENIFGPALLAQAIDNREKTPRDEHAIVPELNQDRFNILFMGLGNEAEAMTDSMMVLSYQPSTNKLSLFSFPRDLHAPEVDRFNQKTQHPNTQFNAINLAYQSGGNELASEIAQDATGLKIDYKVVATMQSFVKIAGKLFGDVEVELDEELGDTTLGLDLPPGKHKLDPNMLLSVAISRKGSSEVGRAGRQQIVLNAIMDAFQKKWSEGLRAQAGLLIGLKDSISELQKTGEIQTDLDLNGLIFPTIMKILQNAPALALGDLKFSKPAIQRFVIDEESGLMQENKAKGIREHLMTLKGGDHTAEDLPNGYWKTVRSKVKSLILA